MCLGRDDAADLRLVVRSGAADTILDQAILAAIARKPKGHDFVIDQGHAAAVPRHVSMTGG